MTAPDHEFTAFIDEAGDPGLRRVRPIDDVGGTEWFTISAVVTRRHNDENVVQWLSGLTSKVGAARPHILHFKDLPAASKLTVCQDMAELPIRIFVVASNKKNMRLYQNDRAERAGGKQWFYNWMAQILMERVTDYCFRYAEERALARRHVKIIFSQTGGHSYSQTAAYHALLKSQSRGNSTFLGKWVPKWQVMHWELVENYPHSKIAGLQLADVAASAFYQAIDNLDTGPCTLEYAKALRPRIATTHDGSARDYGVVLQPTPDWKADISADQQAIFRHYGYEFKRW